MIGALILTQQNMKCRFVFMCTNSSLQVSGGKTWEMQNCFAGSQSKCWVLCKAKQQEQPSVKQAGMRCRLVSFPRNLSPFCYYLFLKILFNSISCYQGTGGGQRLVFDALSATGLLLTEIDQCQVIQAGKIMVKDSAVFQNRKNLLWNMEWDLLIFVFLVSGHRI